MSVSRSREPIVLVLVLVLGLVLGGCGAASPPPADPSDGHGQSSSSAEHADLKHAHRGHGHADMRGAEASNIDPTEKKLDEVAVIHGAPGPWAVAGYRMSEYALAKLGVERGSFDLQIVHWTPKEVRYSCIADGAAAYSGASLGKLNLSLVETSADNVLTVYRNKKTGVSVALRPAASFRERYADTPREKARELGREVLGLPADQVFEEIPVK